MSTDPLYDQWEMQVKNQGRAEAWAEAWAEGWVEGWVEGWIEGQRMMLLDLLSTRFGVVPDAALARINAADVAKLRRWAKRLLSAPTLEDVLSDA